MKKLSDKDFMKAFSQVETEDEAKGFFYELFKNRSLTILPDADARFRRIAAAVLPQILAQTVKIKNAELLFKGEYKEVHIWKECESNIPYLVRKPKKEEPLGIIRLEKRIGNNRKMNVYELKDYISFPKTFNKSTSLVKFNDEKMQMFSVVYKNHDVWRELDHDAEFMTEEEIRKAVLWVAKNGTPVLNIEHKKDLEVGLTQARVIEFYQARTGWKEGNLEIRKGDLVSTTQFFNEDLWNFTKENFETYSMQGTGDTVDIEEETYAG